MAGILLSRPGRHYTFRKLEFWAEQGQVHLLDYSKDSYNPEFRIIMVRDMLKRAAVFNRAARRMKYADERNEHILFVENIIACCREAKRQGRPDDPRTFEHIRNLRSKHILLPGPDIRISNFVGAAAPARSTP